jgi:hypothetical protein
MEQDQHWKPILFFLQITKFLAVQDKMQNFRYLLSCELPSFDDESDF